LLRHSIREAGVGGEFPIARLSRPRLHAVNQRRANTLPTDVGIDIPALEVRHRTRRAALGNATCPDLREAAKPVGLPFRTKTAASGRASQVAMSAAV